MNTNDDTISGTISNIIKTILPIGPLKFLPVNRISNKMNKYIFITGKKFIFI